MALIDVQVETSVSTSVRAKQLSSAFDVPAQERHALRWKIDAPYEERDWNVGLIVGASGSGKSTILRNQFGDERIFGWGGESVIDDFASEFSVEQIAAACSAVGFNTIPAWLRPYHVLSNGEQFRVSLARRMLETPPDETIVVDEFTSVVDRQVAQIGAHAVAKWVRREQRQFVAASCHYDILDWLQPDWVIDAATRTFSWRSVQPRARVRIDIRPVKYSAWHLFAQFHYLTSELHRGARCFVLYANDRPAAFAGLLHRPHAKVDDIMGVSRLVTLPDWQGLGLAFVLVDALGGAYKHAGKRLRTYPAHPSLIRGFDRSRNWALRQKPGFAGGGQTKGVVHGPNAKLVDKWRHGARPCAVFEYVGAKYADRDAALMLLSEAHGRDMSSKT